MVVLLNPNENFKLMYKQNVTMHLISNCRECLEDYTVFQSLS